MGPKTPKPRGKIETLIKMVDIHALPNGSKLLGDKF